VGQSLSRLTTHILFSFVFIINFLLLVKNKLLAELKHQGLQQKSPCALVGYKLFHAENGCLGCGRNILFFIGKVCGLGSILVGISDNPWNLTNLFYPWHF